jgi:hypothetical protein
MRGAWRRADESPPAQPLPDLAVTRPVIHSRLWWRVTRGVFGVRKASLCGFAAFVERSAWRQVARGGAADQARESTTRLVYRTPARACGLHRVPRHCVLARRHFTRVGGRSGKGCGRRRSIATASFTSTPGSCRRLARRLRALHVSAGSPRRGRVLATGGYLCRASYPVKTAWLSGKPGYLGGTQVVRGLVRLESPKICE